MVRKSHSRAESRVVQNVVAARRVVDFKAVCQECLEKLLGGTTRKLRRTEKD